MAKEYIERGAVAKKAICMHGFGNVKYVPLSAIMNQAAADVVEVVRCKDCMHWHENIGWCDKHSRFILRDGSFYHLWESTERKMFNADYFCADGERRDNDA